MRKVFIFFHLAALGILTSCGPDDDSADLKRYLQSFDLSIVYQETNEDVIGTGEGQTAPEQITVYTEEWEETGFVFEKLCPNDPYQALFLTDRPNPKYLGPDHKKIYYIQLGDDVDTLILTFGEKEERQLQEVETGTYVYYLTTFTYDSYSIEELEADRTDCASSFVVYK